MELQLNIEFSVAEINLVLAALSQRPWAEVSGLMEKIKAQGEAQLAAAPAVGAPVEG